MNSEAKLQNVVCRCGEVKFEVLGEPIMHAACYCNSCQKAGRQLKLAPAAPQVLAPDGGTDFVLFRKDRINLVSGQDRLVDHRLTPQSLTRRVVASCCNTPIFLEFAKGHWVSVFRPRLPPAVRPLEMRVMTKDKPASVNLPNDVPNYPGYSGKFMWKLLRAWAAMRFRIPRLSW